MRKKFLVRACGLVIVLLIFSGCVKINTNTTIENGETDINSIISCDVTIAAMERAAQAMNVIASGLLSSFAIQSDGSLWFWGHNALGFDETLLIYSHDPLHIMDDVVAVSASSQHMLAIRYDGSLWAMGDNQLGELGDGTTINRQIPVKIMEDVIAISAWGGSSSAITSDGGLWTWGGHDSFRDRPPIRVLEDVVAVDGGYIIKTDRSLWVRSWQYGFVHVMDDVLAVSTGMDHTMVIRTDGSLWTWGQNRYGQLGDGTTTRTERESPVRIMEDVVAVSAGRHYSMAIQSDGSLWAWGVNGYGQLGDGTTKHSHIPIHIMDNVVAVVAGGIDFAMSLLPSAVHTIAVKADGSLWGWGENVNVWFGDETIPSEERGYIPLKPVKLMDNIMLPSNSN